MAIALARGAPSFIISSSWFIGASGVAPFASFLTLRKFGKLIIHHLVKSVAIYFHELFLNRLQAPAFPSEVGPRGTLSSLKAASSFHVLEHGKFQYGSQIREHCSQATKLGPGSRKLSRDNVAQVGQSQLAGIQKAGFRSVSLSAVPFRLDSSFVSRILKGPWGFLQLWGHKRCVRRDRLGALIQSFRKKVDSFLARAQ